MKAFYTILAMFIILNKYSFAIASKNLDFLDLTFNTVDVHPIISVSLVFLVLYCLYLDYKQRNIADHEKVLYDRKNVELEYKYCIDIISWDKRTAKSILPFDIHNVVNVEFILENLGRRILTIIGAEILINTEKGELELKASREVNEKGNVSNLKSIILTVSHQSSESIKLLFSENESQRLIKEETLSEFTLILILSNGKRLVKNYKKGK